MDECSAVQCHTSGRIIAIIYKEVEYGSQYTQLIELYRLGWI